MKNFQFNNIEKINNIFHLADIHIPNDTDRHNEFIHVFNNLYKTIKSKCNKNSLIIICGDIIDKSGKISPNCINLCKSFLLNLSKLSYLIIIPGNHDDNIRGNDIKIDSLSSIIEGLNYKNLFYFRETGIYHFNNIDFYHLSVFDTNRIISKPKNNNNIKICLYHGMISSEIQNFNNKFLNYEFNYKDFKNYDFVFLGDIHKHYYLNNNKTIAYSGSLLQLNYGEDIIQHGGLLHWDLINKNSNFINISNDYGFINIDFKNNEFILPNFIPKKLKLKINIYGDYISNNKLYNLIQPKLPINTEIIEFKLNYINNLNINKSINQFIDNNNDLETYLKNYKKLSNDKIKTILNLHNNELKKINYATDSIKNIWNINYIEFENILGYQKKQKIDFNKIRNKNKLCGLFGKNAQGKSSIISIILYSIFGSIPDIINNDIPNKYNKKLKTNIFFNLGTDLYNIQRTIRTVKLFKNDINISENSKVDTNSKIKNLIGDINIIKNTNISLQEQHNNIIYCSNSDKLKILKKILGLDIYELIYNNIKSFIKELQTKFDILNNSIIDKKHILNTKDTVLKDIDNFKNTLDLYNKLESNSNNFTIINNLNNQINKYKNKINNLHSQIKSINTSFDSNDITKNISITSNKINNINEKMNDLYRNIIPNINENQLDELIQKNNNINSLLINISKNKISHKNIPKYKQNITDLTIELNNINTKIIDLNRNIIPINLNNFFNDNDINDNDINDNNINDNNINDNNINDNNINDNNINDNDKDNINNDNINDIEKILKENNDKLDVIMNKNDKYNKKKIKLINKLGELNENLGKFDKNIEKKYKKFNKNNLEIKNLELNLENNLNSIKKYKKNLKKHKCKYNDNCSDCLYNKQYNGIIDLNNNIKELEDENKEINDKINELNKKNDKMGDMEQIYENYLNTCENLKNCNLDIDKNNMKLSETNINSKTIKDLIKNIQNYHNNINNNNIIYNKLDILNNKKTDIESNILNYNNLIDNFEKINEFNTEISQNNIKISNIQNNISLNTQLNDFNIKLNKLNKELEEYNKLIDIFNNNKLKINKYNDEIEEYNLKINEIKNEIENIDYNENLDKFCPKKKIECIKNLGIFENKLDEINKINIDSQNIELNNIENQLNNYKLYNDIINYRGFPIYLIEKKKEILQNEINKILNTIVDFEIKIDLINENLIFYKKILNDKDNDIIPIKNCSGFEKFIFSISLRIGLINISNFMKPNFIIIDEGFGNMDNINIKKLNDVFDNIKNNFDLILIITHKEELKEKFNNIITVKNFKLY